MHMDTTFYAHTGMADQDLSAWDKKITVGILDDVFERLKKLLHTS